MTCMVLALGAVNGRSTFTDSAEDRHEPCRDKHSRGKQFRISKARGGKQRQSFSGDGT